MLLCLLRHALSLCVQVLVGGLPCAVDVSSVTATQLSCRAPSIAGQLLAEFWQMPTGTRVIPEDVGAYTRPGGGARRRFDMFGDN
jgi:hypothetical protein